MANPDGSAAQRVRDEPLVDTIPIGVLGRMRQVLTSDSAIWQWWITPLYKLRDRTPREVHESGGFYEVEAVVKGYLHDLDYGTFS